MTETVSLHQKYRLEVFCQLACELLFRMEPECGNVHLFANCFEWYFKTSLSLSQLQAESIQGLIAMQELQDFVKVYMYRCTY